MRRALRLGRYGGIDVFLHWSFALLVAWVAYLSWRGTHSLTDVRDGILVVLGLFFCVLLHEYGHALTARRFGIGTRRITLLPIGGVALLEGMPERPREEILIALGGPAVNLVIAAGVSLWIVAGLPDGHGFAQTMLRANLLLAGFNLLPAFPMDGGRVLRSVFWFWQPLPRATWTAAWIGRAVAVGLALHGASHNPILVLIAVFVWYAGGAEARAVAARETRAARRPAAAAAPESCDA